MSDNSNSAEIINATEFKKNNELNNEVNQENVLLNNDQADKINENLEFKPENKQEIQIENLNENDNEKSIFLNGNKESIENKDLNIMNNELENEYKEIEQEKKSENIDEYLENKQHKQEIQIENLNENDKEKSNFLNGNKEIIENKELIILNNELENEYKEIEQEKKSENIDEYLENKQHKQEIQIENLNENDKEKSIFLSGNKEIIENKELIILNNELENEDKEIEQEKKSENIDEEYLENKQQQIEFQDEEIINNIENNDEDEDEFGDFEEIKIVEEIETNNPINLEIEKNKTSCFIDKEIHEIENINHLITNSMFYNKFCFKTKANNLSEGLKQIKNINFINENTKIETYINEMKKKKGILKTTIINMNEILKNNNKIQKNRLSNFKKENINIEIKEKIEINNNISHINNIWEFSNLKENLNKILKIKSKCEDIEIEEFSKHSKKKKKSERNKKNFLETKSLFDNAYGSSVSLKSFKKEREKSPYVLKSFLKSLNDTEPIEYFSKLNQELMNSFSPQNIFIEKKQSLKKTFSVLLEENNLDLSKTINSPELEQSLKIENIAIEEKKEVYEINQNKQNNVEQDKKLDLITNSINKKNSEIVIKSKNEIDDVIEKKKISLDGLTAFGFDINLDLNDSFGNEEKHKILMPNNEMECSKIEKVENILPNYDFFVNNMSNQDIFN